jgi:phage terminase small subunit
MSEQSDAAKKALKNLSPQRRKFVEVFCACFNGTKAALAAKYSAKTARIQASQLLTILNIKIAIKAVPDTAAMDPEEIAAQWTALARAGLDDFYTKVEYEEATKVLRPLIERIAELEYEYSFENRVASRQVLSEGQLERHSLRQNGRRNDIIRLQVELEMNPAATYRTDGPPEKKYRMQLDLVKAADLGLLDLAKAITPTEFGLKVELRSQDAALDNLAKWRGMLTTKIDLTTKGEKLPVSPVLGLLTLEQKKEMLTKMKQAQQEGGTGV